VALVLLPHDPLAGTLLLLALLWLSAKVGGELALRLKLPPVTGELTAGLALAALHGAWGASPDVAASPAMELLGGLGVVVLMFAVGLESTVPQMLKVGLASLRVALLGVALPLAAGLAGAWILLPKGSPFVLDLFIGACLCATSIGISAQVLREKKVSHSVAGRIIVGAAVLDDVLGLLVLVAVSGLVGAASGGSAGPGLAGTLALALGFLAVAFTLGRVATPPLFRLASRFRSEEVLLPLGLGFAFLLAWLGSLAGLASIVGAYAAGLILEPAHIEDLERRERRTLEGLVHPLVTVLSPLYFVLMGARIDPAAFCRPATLALAGTLAALGVAGKLAAGLGSGGGPRAAVVGWGMVPRGEVGLIFVATGARLQLHGAPLLSPDVQAAVVGALLLTTIAGPVGLGWALRSKA
jgi:Kef-type K+ transport system membrane component KefB